MNKIYIRIHSIVSIVVFSIMYFLLNKYIKMNFIGLILSASTITYLLVLYHEFFLWKIIVNYLHKFFNINVIPILKSEYNVVMNSSFDDNKRYATLIVKQSFSNVSIKMNSRESHSISIVSSITNVNGENKLIYHYINDPKTENLKNSPRHYGTAIITIEDDGPLKGFYYTDRGTRGDMEFVAVEE